jgi:outer membrane lipoprotein-sorting protein
VRNVNRIVFVTSLLALSVFSSVLHSGTASAQSAQEIVEKADKHRTLGANTTFVVSVNDFAGARKLHETRYRVAVKNENLTLVTGLFPDNQKGRKLLFSGDNLWFFTPDIKRSTRISLQQRLTGEVANGDLANTNYKDDYSAEMAGEETLGSRKTWKLNLKSKSKTATYDGVTYWVEKGTFIPVKAAFRTSGGKVLKNCDYKGIKKIYGIDVVTEMDIVDALKTTRRSVLNYSNFKKEKLDDSLFNKDALGSD